YFYFLHYYGWVAVDYSMATCCLNNFIKMIWSLM
ncbi:MAG: hypothetical protein ACI83I_002917, partial [Bacteroidia bacterium]